MSKGKKWTLSELLDLKTRYENGEGEAQLARHFGVTRYTIRWALGNKINIEDSEMANKCRLVNSDHERVKNYKECLQEYYKDKSLDFRELLGSRNLNRRLPIIPEGVVLSKKFLMSVIFITSLPGNNKEQFDFISDAFFSGNSHLVFDYEDLENAIDTVKRNGYRVQKYIKPTEGHWEEV